MRVRQLKYVRQSCYIGSVKYIILLNLPLKISILLYNADYVVHHNVNHKKINVVELVDIVGYC